MKASASDKSIVVKDLGRCDYKQTWHAMQAFTDARTASTPDELWIVEHEPVFTLGQAGKLEHLLTPGSIPVVKCDRGGQVTYHGPGQIVVYTLIDLRRSGVGIRDLVVKLEQSVVATLASYGIKAKGRRDAPGVYVEDRKIAALGLRVRRGCTFHGLALNASMDLSPFKRINPCGFAGLEVTSTREVGIEADRSELVDRLTGELVLQLG